jgi:tetratricopeptide (TPR) repeat protein
MSLRRFFSWLLTAAIGVTLAAGPAAGGETADKLFQEGVQFHKANDLDAAMKAYEKSLQEDPRNYGALMGSGMVYYSKGAYEKAVQRFNGALAFYPDDVKARLSLGRCFLSLGEAEKARSVFLKIVVDDPTNVTALIGLGEAEDQVGNRFTAVDYLKKALALQPGNKSLSHTIDLMERANRAYLRDEEEQKRQGIKSALNNAIAESNVTRSQAAAQGSGAPTGDSNRAAAELFDLLITPPSDVRDYGPGSRTIRGQSGKRKYIDERPSRVGDSD